MQVGFLGPKGSFSHNAALAAFPKARLLPFSSITEVIKAYKKSALDYVIVPIENSIEGSVHEALDYLYHQAGLTAVAEVIQPIKQQLLAVSAHKEIQKVYSHPQALAQGKKFILTNFPKAAFEITASTAYAARFVAEHPDMPYAAIAPKTAADEYGLSVIAKDIQEIDQNFTRFWVLAHSRQPALLLPAIERKLTLGLTLPDNLPGALYKALSTFAWRGIDLTKIESRPLKTALGEYYFIIDARVTEERLIDFALEELRSIGIDYKILGLYQVYQMERK